MKLILYYPKLEFNISYLIPILLLCVCLYFFITEEKGRIRILKTAFWGIICCLTFIFEIISGIVPVICFNSGDYVTVEGYVENFTPYSRDTMESFMINDVEFNYSHGIIKSGYRKTYNKGGVIQENGQYLRIAYIPNERKNVILCIQEPPFAEVPQNEVSIFRQLYMVVVIPVIMIISFFFGAKYRNRKN